MKSLPEQVLLLMPRRLIARLVPLALATLVAGASPNVGSAQSPRGGTLEETAAPGNNFDKAEFRMWFPAGAGTLRGIAVLVPGSNGDGRAMAEDTVWQAKGGIYYTALAPRGARNVPGIPFVGGKDLEFRTNSIVGLFAVNRRAGALWALAEEPNAGSPDSLAA